MRPMGTTIVGLLIDQEEAQFFNVGDSNAYRIRGAEIVEMSIEDRHAHASGNVITQCLGGGTPRPKVHQSHTKIEPGDRFVLSSDGVTNNVPKGELLRLLSNKRQTMAQDICEKAIELGSDDDISAVCIEI